MIVADLPAYLRAYNIPDYMYSLDGGGDDEVVGIVRTGNEWTVYSASRGSKNILLVSEKEDQAVEKFLYYLSKNVEAWGLNLPVPPSETS